MHRLQQGVGSLVLCAALSACIPVPLALPPAKGSIGMAAAVGNPLPDPDGVPLTSVEPIAHGKVGLMIQSMWPTQHRRPVEIEAGYAYQVFPSSFWQRRNRHGFYGGVSILGGHFWMGDNWRLRITIRGSAEYFVLQGLPGDGGGGSWALGFEFAQYTHHESREGDSGPRLIGWMAGEISVGFELVGGYHSVAGADYGTIGAALTLRWPGIFGVAMVPLSGNL